MEEWKYRLHAIRSGVEDFIKIPDFPEAGWDPANDPVFWETLNAIERAGDECDTSKALWLANLTQVDDLGPMGRALFLARAALSVLSLMPDAALLAAKDLLGSLPPDASSYRKVGVCKVLEASGLSDAIPLIRMFINDNDSYVAKESKYALSHLIVSILEK